MRDYSRTKKIREYEKISSFACAVTGKSIHALYLLRPGEFAIDGEEGASYFPCVET